MKILILKGESSYEALRLMADRFALGLVGKAQTEIIDLLTWSSEDLLKRFLRLDYNLVVSFNATMTQALPLSNGDSSTPLLSLVPVPHICWMLDDLIYHFERLKVRNKFRIVLSSSAEHQDFLDTLDSDARHGLMLPGSDGDLFLSGHKNRTYDFLVAASWMGTPLKFWENFEDPLKSIISHAVERVDLGVSNTAYSALKYSMLDRGLSCATSSELITVLIEIDNYLRQKERIALIDAIARSGFKLGVVGSGWDHLKQNPKVVIIPSVSSKELLHFYQDSRVVVNLNARNGGSERLFDGISQGATVLSPWSELIFDSFSDVQAVKLIKYPLEDHIQEAIENLSDFRSTEEYASSGQNEIRAKHLWHHKAQQVLNFIN